MNPNILVDQKEGFFIQQFFTGCLAEMAYYIESKGKAVVIDPLRDTTLYLKLAEERKAKIEYVLLTHFHADFVSGHIDLASKTGATIVFGPTAAPKFQAKIAKDDEKIALGDVHIKVLHTPGHTPESSCFLLEDTHGKPYAIFTGDTLFLGDVGRPDLAVSGNDLTREVLAGWLYDSLHKKIIPLSGDVIIYPGHGAGSPCGKNISKGTTDTLANQKNTNYALQVNLPREEFIKILVEGIPEAPQYFFHDAALNKNGYEMLESIVKKNSVPLNPQQVLEHQKQGATILDCRAAQNFLDSHIPGSLTVNLDMTYAIHVGTLVGPDQPLVLVAPLGREEESIIRLARVGYEKVLGYLEGGYDSYQKAGLNTASVQCIEPEQYKEKIFSTNHKTLDCRNPGEYDHERLATSVNIPLSKLKQVITSPDSKVDKESLVYVYCKGGNRSAAACSILKQNGYNNIINIKGGIGKLEEIGVPIEH